MSNGAERTGGTLLTTSRAMVRAIVDVVWNVPIAAITFCVLAAAVVFGGMAGAAAGAARSASSREFHDLWVAGVRLFDSFEAPDETRRLLARVIADIRKLDLSGLYAALPDSGRADRARLIAFHAKAENGVRRVSHQPLRSPIDAKTLFEPAASPEPLAAIGPEIGDGWLVGGAVPLDAERFRVRASTALRIGGTDLSNAGMVAVDFLRRLELRARVDGKADAFSALLAEDYPKANDFLGRYVRLGGGVAWDEAKGRIRFAPQLGARPGALAADYPLFARFVVRSSGVLRAVGRVTDDAGARLATWAFLGLDGLEIEVAIRDARLLPLDGGGDGHPLDRPLRLSFDSDVSIEAFGLRTAIDGAQTTLALDPAAGRLATSAAGMPRRTGIDGALFGVLTPGALDLMVPGTIDGILRDLLRSVLEGRERRGVEALVRADERDDRGFLLRSDAALDVSSAPLVRVALAIGARWLYPTDEEAADATRFVHDFAGRLVADAGSLPPG